MVLPVTHEASDLSQTVAIDGESLICGAWHGFKTVHETMFDPSGYWKDVKGILDVTWSAIWVVF